MVSARAEKNVRLLQKHPGLRVLVYMLAQEGENKHHLWNVVCSSGLSSPSVFPEYFFMRWKF